MDPQGSAVLAAGGNPINLPENATQISISPDGTLTVDGQIINRLGVFEATGELQRETSTYFVAPEGYQAIEGGERVFDFYVDTLKRIAPDATWTGAGIGRHQITLNEWSLERGRRSGTSVSGRVTEHPGPRQPAARNRSWGLLGGEPSASLVFLSLSTMATTFSENQW